MIAHGCRMDQEVKAEWVAALRSGKYLQGYNRLRTFDDRYCVMGVLADVMGLRWGKGTSSYTVLANSCDLHECFLERIRLDSYAQATLNRMNDQGVPFEDLADWIEENL